MGGVRGQDGGGRGDKPRIVANKNRAVRPVPAVLGKTARAEPVAALFEAKKARLAGCFPELEDELAGLTMGGAYRGPGRSPDRADAMVWAVSELMRSMRGEGPRVLQL